MARRATRRRENGVGAVTVTELLKQQPLPVRIPSREEQDSAGFVRELLDQEASPEHRPHRLLRVFGLTAGVLVLGGAIAAAAIIGAVRHNRQSPQAVPMPVAITGAAALRPDAFSTQVNESHLTKEVAATKAGTPPKATSLSPSLLPLPAVPTATTQNSARQQHIEATTATPLSEVAVVREFYRRVLVDPDSALTLVDPRLSNIDQIGFVKSWGSVRTIQPEVIEARPDNSVLGVVAIQQSDGDWLRVEQVLHLSDGPTPKIIDAEILSAQHT